MNTNVILQLLINQPSHPLLHCNLDAQLDTYEKVIMLHEDANTFHFSSSKAYTYPK